PPPQPPRAAAVHPADAGPGQPAHETPGCLRILGARSGRRAAEHADAFHGVAGVSQASANSALSAPVYTSSTGPSSFSDQSGRTSITRSPPGIRTVTLPWSQSPLRTAADAAPHEEGPEASV